MYNKMESTNKEHAALLQGFGNLHVRPRVTRCDSRTHEADDEVCAHGKRLSLEHVAALSDAKAFVFGH